MLEIRNKYIPFKGFGAMNILGILFVRGNHKVTNITYCHEAIHTAQQYEILALSAVVSLVLCNIFASWWYLLGIVLMPFVLYFVGYLAEIVLPPYYSNRANIQKGDSLKVRMGKIGKMFAEINVDAYRDNCFEREAYMNEKTPIYLARRVPFAWVSYIIKGKERKRK